MKKLMLIGALTVAAAAFSLPTVASAANWSDEGYEIDSNAAIPMIGSASFTGSLGGVNCTAGATATLTLTAGSSNGAVDSFNPEESNCDLTGGLAATCTALTAVHVPASYAAHNNGTDVTITGVHLTNTFSGGFLCPKTITLSGNVTVTADPNKKAIESVTVSGRLTSTVGGEVTVFGAFGPVNASDKNTYGFAPEGNEWWDEGVPLASNVTVPLAGQIGFTTSAFGLSCTKISASLTLTGGTSRGTLDEMDPDESQCDLTGSLAAVCTGLAKVDVEGTPTVQNKGGDMKWGGIVFKTTFTGGALCPESLVLAGSFTASPTPNREAISSFDLSGTFASWVGDITLEGAFAPVNASDKGTYGF